MGELNKKEYQKKQKVTSVLNREQREAIEEVRDFLTELDTKETELFKVFIQGAKVLTLLRR